MRQYSTSSEGNDEKGEKDGKKPSANDLIYCKYAIFRPAHVITGHSLYALPDLCLMGIPSLINWTSLFPSTLF